MKARKSEDTGFGFLSVIAGIAVLIVMCVLLLSYTQPLFDNLFRLTDVGQDSELKKNDLVLGLTLFSWLFIGSLSGGIACCSISGNNDLVQVLICSLISIILIFLVSGENVFGKGHFYTSICILISIPLGNISGITIGKFIKRRRERSFNIRS
jgi:hypothetical protein